MRRSQSRLLIVPQDIRTSDPTIAVDIYNGRFVFGGQSVETGGASPFTLLPPSEDWERGTHGFGWLRHLRAADTDLARSNARALTEDWIKSHSRLTGVAWYPEVAARRILSLLSQTPIILHDADHEFYGRFIRCAIRHGAYLRTNFTTVEPGVDRIRVATAIAMVGLSVSQQDDLLRSGLDRLDRELSSQVLPDGGHISRNPAVLTEILTDLLPLRQALIARGQTPSPTMMGAIDRMMPMIRFFRHGDGTFAQFNGMASSATDTVATILAHDETLGTPVSSATYSGYERIERGDSLVLVDAGLAPPISVSSRAHAGTLSFEFSSGIQRVVINCGAPAARHGALRRASRETNAHSTAILNNLSSSLFSDMEADAALVPGPKSIPLNRRTLGDGSIVLETAHDGYLRELGLVHERDLMLNADGSVLRGIDRFSGTPIYPENGAVIRFHLDPKVKLVVTSDDRSLELELADGSIWRFRADTDVTWDESVCLSNVYGSRQTSQIVITKPIQGDTHVDWQFVRTD